MEPGEGEEVAQPLFHALEALLVRQALSENPVYIVSPSAYMLSLSPPLLLYLLLRSVYGCSLTSCIGPLCTAVSCPSTSL